MPVIELRDLDKRYGDRVAVDDVSFTVEEGEILHFMEEAERLCDRPAVVDAGRVVAVDTPAGLMTRTVPGRRIRFRRSDPVPAVGSGSGRRIRFRPSEPLDDAALRGLPGGVPSPGQA